MHLQLVIFQYHFYRNEKILTAVVSYEGYYSQVRLEDNTVLTAKQIQELQKRNAQLEEENLILKKASAIFMQNSK